MPRLPRIKSATGIYHVMLRGVNKQQIFYDDEDCKLFIRLVAKYKSISGYHIYAFCIMGNHIHLLIQIEQEPLDIVMKRIAGAFAYWYNAKYERVGHLFQDRFRSEPVNDERYFFTVLRYIIRNPVKAGLCSSPGDYEYSSGKEYLQSEKGITDTGFVEGMVGKAALRYFLFQDNDDECLDVNDDVRIKQSDASATELIMSEFGAMTPSVEIAENRELLFEVINRLIRKGVSIRQLSRLSGISKRVIEKALKR